MGEGGGEREKREGKRSSITVSRPLTVDLVPAATSHQTLCATETNVALCSMSFPHYGSNGPDFAPASVSLSVWVRLAVATLDTFNFFHLGEEVFFCFFVLFLWNTLKLQTKLVVYRERELSLEPQFVLLQWINLLWQRRKWPVQRGSHFKSFSCECSFSPFCPPRFIASSRSDSHTFIFTSCRQSHGP